MRAHDDEDAEYDASPYAVVDRLEVTVEDDDPVGTILDRHGDPLVVVHRPRLPFKFEP